MAPAEGLPVKVGETLPEVVLLRDARGERPTNAVGIGGFWYEPEVWTLSLSPAAKVLYAGLCSFLGHGEIHRKDLRATLKESPDEDVAAALEELVRHRLLQQSTDGALPGYAVGSVGEYEGRYRIPLNTTEGRKIEGRPLPSRLPKSGRSEPFTRIR